MDGELDESFGWMPPPLSPRPQKKKTPPCTAAASVCKDWHPQVLHVVMIGWMRIDESCDVPPRQVIEYHQVYVQHGLHLRRELQ